MPQATLYNPETGDRQAVESGSEQAQSLFDQGYHLETSYDPNTGVSTWDEPGPPADPIPPSTPEPEEEDDTSDEIIIEPPPPESSPIGDANQALADEIDAQIEQLNQIDNSLEGWKANLEEEYQPIIDSLKNSFALRKTQMQQLNRASLAGLTAAGIRAGRQRYANEIHTGILSAEEAAGIQRLAKIDSEEALAIAEIKMAISDKAWDRFNDTSDRLRNLHKDKIDALISLRDANWAEEDRRRQKLVEGREDQEYEWKVEDRLREEALRNLEYLITGNIPISELTDEEYKKMEEDLGMLEGSLEGLYVNMMDAAQAEAQGNLEERDIAILNALVKIPSNQTVMIGGKEYRGLKEPKKASGDGSGGGNSAVEVDLSPDNIRKLVGAGWNQATIGAVVEALNTPDPDTGEYYSLAEILEVVGETTDITAEMRSAMQKVFGTSEMDFYEHMMNEGINDSASLGRIVTEISNNIFSGDELSDTLYDPSKLDTMIEKVGSRYNLTRTHKNILRQLVLDDFNRNNQ